ncbi:MAG: hypothetical protein JNN28_21840 [Saprospiraceae bacterium]|nr:hypothetical protein [Saprospiraceae bacterium]
MKFREVIKLPKRMLWALVMEGVETSRMVHVYARHGTGKLRIIPKHKKPTPEELKEASEQLKDLPRFLPFFVVVAVPVPGVTEGYALVAVTLEKWLGNKFRLLPSQFREIIESATEDTEETASEKDATSGKKHLPGA